MPSKLWRIDGTAFLRAKHHRSTIFAAGAVDLHRDIGLAEKVHGWLTDDGHRTFLDRDRNDGIPVYWPACVRSAIATALHSKEQLSMKVE